MILTRTFVAVGKPVIPRQTLVTLSSTHVLFAQALAVVRVTTKLAEIGPVHVAATKLTTDQRVESISVLDALIAAEALDEAWTQTLARELVAKLVHLAFALHALRVVVIAGSTSVA
jgi:hypothetical protein